MANCDRPQASPKLIIKLRGLPEAVSDEGCGIVTLLVARKATKTFLQVDAERSLVVATALGAREA